MSLDVYTQNIPLTQKATVNSIKNYQRKYIEMIEVPKDCKGRKTTKSLLTRSNFCLLVQFWSNYVSALKGEEDLRAPEEPTTRIMWVLSSYEIPVLY